jgi:hypothetical protein
MISGKNLAAFANKKPAKLVIGKPVPVLEPDEEDAPPDADAGDQEAPDPERLAQMVDEAAQDVEDEKDGMLLALCDKYDPEADGNPPSWAVQEGTWEKAKEAVDPEGKGVDFDEPWAVVAHVYKAMGGTFGRKG